MKSREEYVASIFAKRDALLKKRKKHISYLSAAICLAVCITVAFFAIPERFGSKKEPTINRTEESIVSTTAVFLAEEAEVEEYLGSFSGSPEKHEQTQAAVNEIYKEEGMFDDAGKAAADAATKKANTTVVQDYLAGGASHSPSVPAPDRIEATEFRSESKAENHTADEAVKEAYKYVKQSEISDIDKSKTNVVISHNVNGTDYYTVYFYTETKVITVKLNAATLEMIECGEKSLTNGSENYYSPAHFPETTSALPEYKPQ